MSAVFQTGNSIYISESYYSNLTAAGKKGSCWNNNIYYECTQQCEIWDLSQTLYRRWTSMFQQDAVCRHTGWNSATAESCIIYKLLTNCRWKHKHCRNVNVLECVTPLQGMWDSRQVKPKKKASLAIKYFFQLEAENHLHQHLKRVVFFFSFSNVITWRVSVQDSRKSQRMSDNKTKGHLNLKVRTETKSALKTSHS